MTTRTPTDPAPPLPFSDGRGVLFPLRRLLSVDLVDLVDPFWASARKDKSRRSVLAGGPGGPGGPGFGQRGERQNRRAGKKSGNVAATCRNCREIERSLH